MPVPSDEITTQPMHVYLRQGFLDSLPLCVAVFPWGLLAGSMAVHTGLDFWQSMGMSAIIFAGAAQLVTLGLIASNASILSIMITIFFITAQHLLYGLTFRERVRQFSLRSRMMIGFLLTDELFAVASHEKCKYKTNKYYLASVGFTFYLFWNVFNLIGIMIAKNIPHLAQYHLDFSIVATFIAIIVPLIKNVIYLLGVVISIVLSVLLHHYHVQGAVVIAGLLAMLCCGFLEGRNKK